MMKPIKDFVSRFNTQIALDESLILTERNRHYLINENLRKLILPSFFYAGIYLGKTRNGQFLPSVAMLSLIAKRKANKIIINEKTEWLFICGRDVFRQGIVTVSGSRRKGDHTLILNQHGECLGFGLILQNLEEINERVAVKNISDLGDFLRRER